MGATTRAGLLTSPLRDRFGIVLRLDFYSIDELAEIVAISAGKLRIPVDDAGAREVAARSRGTPRVANRLLRRVRDYAEVRGDGRVTSKAADAALTMLEVDQRGLDAMDRRLLHAIAGKFNGGPVGVDSLSAAISEERDTVEDVIEPFLIQEGFVMRTPRGRVATEHAYRHLGLLPQRAQPQPDIFHAKGEPSRSPAEGSHAAGEPSRTPAEGLSHARGKPLAHPG